MYLLNIIGIDDWVTLKFHSQLIFIMNCYILIRELVFNIYQKKINVNNLQIQALSLKHFKTKQTYNHSSSRDYVFMIVKKVEIKFLVCTLYIHLHL